MAIIDIQTLRQSLKNGLSRDLVQKIITKYENTDFSVLTTNNGTKLTSIDSFSEENKVVPKREDVSYFLNRELKIDYLESRGAYLSVYAEKDAMKQREIVSQASKVIKESLYSRPFTLSLNSGVLLGNPQIDEPCHILTLNTDGNSLTSVVKAIYEVLREREIPFDIEIPKYTEMKNGANEAIRLHVATMDLEATLKAINSIDKVYKDKCKAPNMFNANIENFIGYDSYLDVNGERASDKLGVTIVKAMDKTIAELGKDVKIDDMSVVDYLKQADNQDQARQRCLSEIKKITPNVIDPILIYCAEIIKNERIDLDPEQIFLSDMAGSQLNAEFGVEEETIEEELENEIENENEIEFEEEQKTNMLDSIAEKVVPVVETVKTGVKGVFGVKDLLSNQMIQSAIDFGNTGLNRVAEEASALDKEELELPKEEELELPGEKTTPEEDTISELQVDNPEVTVVEPMEKENTLDEDEIENKEEVKPIQFDTIDDDLAPIFKRDEPVRAAEEALMEAVRNGRPKPFEAIVVPERTHEEVLEEPKEKVQDIEESLPGEETEFKLPGEEDIELPGEKEEISSEEVHDIKLPEKEEIFPKEEPLPFIETPPVVENPIFSLPGEEEKEETHDSEKEPEISGDIFKDDIEIPRFHREEPEEEENDYSEEMVEENPDIEEEEPKLPTEKSISDEEARLDAMLDDVMDKHDTIEIPTIKEDVPYEEKQEETESKIEEEEKSNDEIKEEDPLFVRVWDEERSKRNEEVEEEPLRDEYTKEDEEDDDILSAISRVAEDNGPNSLTTEEKIAVVADTMQKSTPDIDPEKEAKIARYNGVSQDPAIYDFVIKDEEGNAISKDGKKYTFLDYLEDNDVLSIIPLDSRIYLTDDTQRESVDGRTFIRDYVLVNSVNGNRDIKDIVERYVKRISKSDEPETKKHGLFGFGRK